MSQIALAAGTADLVRGTFTSATGVVTLTKVELALIEALWKQTPAPVAVDTLLAEVWGYHPNVKSRTVIVTVQRLRAKIESDPKHPESLLTRRGFGYVLQAHEAKAQPVTVDPVPRVDVRASIADALASHPVVQLVGPSGIGKSTLARGHGLWLDLARADGDLELAARRALSLDQHHSRHEVLTRLASKDAVLDAAENLADAVVAELATLAVSGRWLLTTTRPLVLGRRVVVPPLEPDESRTLLQHQREVLGLSPLSTSDVETLVRTLGGIPLWLCLAAPLAEFVAEDPTLVLELERDDERATDLFAQTVATCDADVRALLRCCAAFAGPAAPAPLQHTLGLSRMRYLRALADLRERGLVRLESGGVALLPAFRTYLRAQGVPAERDALRGWFMQAERGMPAVRDHADDVRDLLPGSRGLPRMELLLWWLEAAFNFGSSDFQPACDRYLEATPPELMPIAEFFHGVCVLERGETSEDLERRLRTAAEQVHEPLWRRRMLGVWLASLRRLGRADQKGSDELMDLAASGLISDRLDAVVRAAYPMLSHDRPRVVREVQAAIELGGPEQPVRTAWLHLLMVARLDSSEPRRERMAKLLEAYEDDLGVSAILTCNAMLGRAMLDAGELSGAERMLSAAEAMQLRNPARGELVRVNCAVRLLRLDPERARALVQGITTPFASAIAALLHALLDEDLSAVEALDEPDLVRLGRAFLAGEPLPSTTWPGTEQALKVALVMGRRD